MHQNDGPDAFIAGTRRGDVSSYGTGNWMGGGGGGGEGEWEKRLGGTAIIIHNSDDGVSFFLCFLNDDETPVIHCWMLCTISPHVTLA